VFPDGDPLDRGTPTQPYSATVFSSHGQYGSTVWDPMSQFLALQVNICDSCLTHAAKIQRRVALVTETPRTSRWEYEEWEPDVGTSD
jgi:hypothetical protein